MTAGNIEELERLSGRGSRTSSLAPSRGSRERRQQRPKQWSGRRRGGQSGDPGQTRVMVADPDRVVERCLSGAVAAGSGSGRPRARGR